MLLDEVTNREFKELVELGTVVNNKDEEVNEEESKINFLKKIEEIKLKEKSELP